MKTTSSVLSVLFVVALTVTSFAQSSQGKQLFNGKDLTGWEGNPASWSVKDGVIVGVTKADEPLPYNQFLIWRGGTLKNFELTAKVKQSGNNSGLQYRSKELKEVGQWSIGGYQCDIHPEARNNAMLYDERGRAILATNGQTIIIDPEGTRWLVKETDPVTIDVADWNEYTVIARGNHLIHKINGQVAVDVIDHDPKNRDLEGLLAIQIHRGPAMKVEIKDIVLKELPDGEVLTPEQAPVPKDAKKAPAATTGKKAKAN
jgi:hypothetical protein